MSETNKNTFLLILSIAIIIVIFIFIMDKSSPTTKEEELQEEITQEELEKLAEDANEPQESVEEVEDFEELVIEDLTEGDGKEVKTGDTVRVHYTGTLSNGEKFDSSLDRGEPFEFEIGAGKVIQGWEQGLIGMKVGGKRKLLIPSSLGYGVDGSPPAIPSNAGLVFEIELLEVL